LRDPKFHRPPGGRPVIAPDLNGYGARSDIPVALFSASNGCGPLTGYVVSYFLVFIIKKSISALTRFALPVYLYYLKNTGKAKRVKALIDFLMMKIKK